MNGAQRLCDTLLDQDVDVCFANPGTSEMHFVAALDSRPEMRCVLGLSESVVTGAADGYGRMHDKPAATLLHLGPGLANGLSNLHNARRANTPLLNIVGDHARHHLAFDAPLTCDIDALARPMSQWVGRIADGAEVARMTVEACAAARSTPGVATLILPADVAWGDSAVAGLQTAEAVPPFAAEAGVLEAARAIRSARAACILLGGRAMRHMPLQHAEAIARRSGAAVYTETSGPRVERGSGRPAIQRLPYPAAIARGLLERFDTIILVGTQAPVAFFAYPGQPGELTAPGCRIVELAGRNENAEDALARLADELGASDRTPFFTVPALPSMPADDALSATSVAAIVARHLPENAIICDEALTSEGGFYGLSTGSAPHDYLSLTGGSIGIGIPLATGAAIACPGRKVIGLQADGSGMYSLQGLWTQARERLDIVTIIFANRAYRILEAELRNVGVAQAGPNARRMLELTDPHLDWVRLAQGMGVEAARAETVGRFADCLQAALSQRGPMLIEAVI